MKKKNIKKVIKLLSELDSSSMTLEYVLENSKITNNEIIEIFDLLINDDLVFDSDSKDEKCITKKTIIDYYSLSKNIKYNAPRIIKNKQIVISLMIIGLIISIIVGWDEIISFINNLKE